MTAAKQCPKQTEKRIKTSESHTILITKPELIQTGKTKVTWKNRNQLKLKQIGHTVQPINSNIFLHVILRNFDIRIPKTRRS